MHLMENVAWFIEVIIGSSIFTITRIVNAWQIMKTKSKQA